MNKILKTIFFAIGIALFTLLVWDFGIDNIISNVARTGWWFISIIGIWLVVYLLNALSWYLIIDAKNNEISFLNVFSISLSGFAINYITPFVNLGGEPYRIIALKDYLGLSNSVSSTISFTMLHQLSHFFFWITAIVIVFFLFTISVSIKAFLIITLIVLVGLIIFFFSRHKKGIFLSLLRFLSKLPLKKILYNKIIRKEEILLKIDEEIKEFYSAKKKIFYSALSIEFIARLISSLEYYFILKAIGFEATFMDAFLINAGASLIMNILFFIPMGLGSREGGLVLILEGLKYASGVGVYVGLINRIREFFWILIGLLLIQFRRINSEKLKSIKSIPKAYND